jgi:hypothetical protein
MRKYFLAGAFALATLIGVTSQSNADFKIRISSPGDVTLTVKDGDADDLNPAVGAITVVKTVGNFSVSVNTGVSKPLIGNPAAPEMDLSFIATSSAADSLKIELTDTGFTASPGQLASAIAGTVGAFSTVDAKASFDNTNAEFGTAGGSVTHGPFSPPPTAFADEKTLNVFGPTPYSLTMEVNIDADVAGATTSGDFNLSPVPAPAGVLLALTGLPVLGVRAWVRRRKVAA